jgi:hypothetical protein
MADILVLEFSDEGALDLYNKVNSHLGMDDGSGDWPDGLLSHVAGLDGSDLIVVEVWESRDAQEQFMHSRLGPAFQASNVPPPKRAAWFPEVNSWRRG